jgi:hypothetical protein
LRSKDTRYLTITCNGAMLYDSRSDVPVDLEKWAMTWAAHHHLTRIQVLSQGRDHVTQLTR